jgi:DNA-binding SARP family transcriptional activator
MWPEEDPALTGNRLSVALSTLRSVLDPNREFPPDHFIAAEDGVLRLTLENVTLDVDTFLAQAEKGLTLARNDRPEAVATLEAAVAAYTGDFLEENRYEDWADPLRSESRASYIEALRTLATETRLPKYFLRIIERDAYDEAAHLGLVAALEAEGAHGEARRAYRTYLARLQEIEAEPAPYPHTRAPTRKTVRA